MIGNRYLDDLFNYEDEDTSINQLLEYLKYKDPNFIESLKIENVDLDVCTKEEIRYLTIISGLIDYYFQIHQIELPPWVRDKRLEFDTPYYHSKRISDFEKVKLQIQNPAPFRVRNTYFDLDGISRI